MEDWLTNWSSNPTMILGLIAIITLIWQGGRWTGRIENRLKALGGRFDTSLKAIDGRFDTSLKTLRDEMRHEHGETRRTLDTLLLRVMALGTANASSTSGPRSSISRADRGNE